MNCERGERERKKEEREKKERGERKKNEREREERKLKNYKRSADIAKDVIQEEWRLMNTRTT